MEHLLQLLPPSCQQTGHYNRQLRAERLLSNILHFQSHFWPVGITYPGSFDQTLI
jgi:hypothetical protein